MRWDKGHGTQRNVGLQLLRAINDASRACWKLETQDNEETGV